MTTSILVTGGTGLVGGPVAQRLRDAGANITVRSLDDFDCLIGIPAVGEPPPVLVFPRCVDGWVIRISDRKGSTVQFQLLDEWVEEGHNAAVVQLRRPVANPTDSSFKRVVASDWRWLAH